MTAVLSPQIEAGSASITWPITSSSLNAAITIATGGSVVRRLAEVGEERGGRRVVDRGAVHLGTGHCAAFPSAAAAGANSGHTVASPDFRSYAGR